MDNFKKGVELFAIGIALMTAFIAMASFFTTRASTPAEHILVVIYVVIVGGPIACIGAMAIGASTNFMFPESKNIHIIVHLINIVATAGWMFFLLFTEISFDEASDKAENGLTYGLHSVHYYNDQ